MQVRRGHDPIPQKRDEVCLVARRPVEQRQQRRGRRLEHQVASVKRDAHAGALSGFQGIGHLTWILAVAPVSTIKTTSSVTAPLVHAPEPDLSYFEPVDDGMHRSGATEQVRLGPLLRETT
jgi:hypothetical protein